MKKIYFLRSEAIRQGAIAFILSLPLDEDNPIVLKLEEMKRTLDQNSLLWPLLDCFATQKQWPVNGALCWLESEEWKDILTAAYRNETVRLAAGLNGGMVMLGLRTSKMGKKAFSEFIEFILATGAHYEINFEQRKAA